MQILSSGITQNIQFVFHDQWPTLSMVCLESIRNILEWTTFWFCYFCDDAYFYSTGNMWFWQKYGKISKLSCQFYGHILVSCRLHRLTVNILSSIFSTTYYRFYESSHTPMTTSGFEIISASRKPEDSRIYPTINWNQC